MSYGSGDREGTMVAAAGGKAWAGPLLAAVRPVVSARTWLAVIHLVVGWFTGLVVFGIVVVATPVGLVLLPIGLAGAPILWVVLVLSRLYARAERGRFALMLDVRIPDPATGRPRAGRWWQRLRQRLAAAETWKQLGYALARFPLSTAELALVIGAWSIGLAMIAFPAYNGALPRGSTVLGRGHTPVGARDQVLVAAGGLILLLAAPQLTRGLAIADAAVARFLLGPPGRADLQARIGELELSRARVVDSAEAERRRIERDLHDGAQQRLVALAMDLGRARARFADDPEAARAIVDQAHAEAKEALVELRNLVRGVHPPVLTDRGLDAALSGLAALSPVPVSVRVDAAPRPSASVEAIAYFVVAEALTNVAKHARATRAVVSVDRRGDALSVVIRDDGIGGADPRGQGLSGLADRVAGVDGRLIVDSPAGAGTVIEVELPCGS
ncbi:MAG TPA: sensor histidine kinase [Streptosporangiaceae bacterium]|nr:sensor histidine kinase [Streptosporangiaceae bacterium]